MRSNLTAEQKIQAKLANEATRLMQEQNLAKVCCSGPMANEELAKLGSVFWPHTYKQTGEDEKAFDLFGDWADTLEQVNPDLALTLRSSLVVPHEQIRMMWVARWVDQGCPRMVVEGPFAALLMATDVGKDLVNLVAPPWKSFLIEIPSGLLMTTNSQTGAQVWLRKIFAQHITNLDGSKVWNFIIEGEDGIQLWRHGLQTEQLIKFEKGGVWHKEDADLFLQDFGDQDERVLLLTGRLIASLCLALSDPTIKREQKQTHKKWASRRNKHEPDIRTFIIGKPLKVDCRRAIRDYVEGSRPGGKVTVQFLVRGHWRNQPYGPGGTLRKIVRIEPYWKGPEDGKIVTKTLNICGGPEVP